VGRRDSKGRWENTYPDTAGRTKLAFFKAASRKRKKKQGWCSTHTEKANRNSQKTGPKGEVWKKVVKGRRGIGPDLCPQQGGLSVQLGKKGAKNVKPQGVGECGK